METTRHNSVDVLAGYVRRVDLFEDRAGNFSDVYEITNDCFASRLGIACILK
jgi:hypothetical protein